MNHVSQPTDQGDRREYRGIRRLSITILALATVIAGLMLAANSFAHPASPVVLRADGDGLFPDGSQPSLTGGPILDPASVLAYGGLDEAGGPNPAAIRSRVLDLNSCWYTCTMYFTQYDHNFTDCRGGSTGHPSPVGSICWATQSTLGCGLEWCDQARVGACNDWNCTSFQNCDVFIATTTYSNVPCAGYGQCVAAWQPRNANCAPEWNFNCNDEDEFGFVVVTDCSAYSGTTFLKGSPYWDVISNYAPYAPQSHRTFFVGSQSQDKYTHGSNQFCFDSAYGAYGLFKWGEDYSTSPNTPGDCSPFSVAPVSQSWYTGAGWCAALGVPEHGGACTGNCGCPNYIGGPQRAGQGPWKSDWRPDPARLSGRFRMTTSGVPYETVDHKPRLTGRFSDPDNRVIYPGVVGPADFGAGRNGRLQFYMSTNPFAVYSWPSYASGVYTVADGGTANWDVPTYLPDGLWFWGVRTWDHHNLWNDAPLQAFEVSSPGVPGCDKRYYVYRCPSDRDPTCPSASCPTPPVPDTVGIPKPESPGTGTTSTLGANPIFRYTLLENTSPGTTLLKQSSCMETAAFTSVTGARKLNEIVSVHLDLSKFEYADSSTKNNRFGGAQGSMVATLDVRNRSNHDYLYALGCQE